jgi:hypothetical protein
MNKEAIKKELTEKHKEFVDYIDSLSDNDFLNTKNNQIWSAGQHLETSMWNLLFLSKKFRLQLK